MYTNNVSIYKKGNQVHHLKATTPLRHPFSFISTTYGSKYLNIEKGGVTSLYVHTILKELTGPLNATDLYEININTNDYNLIKHSDRLLLISSSEDFSLKFFNFLSIKNHWEIYNISGSFACDSFNKLKEAHTIAKKNIFININLNCFNDFFTYSNIQFDQIDLLSFIQEVEKLKISREIVISLNVHHLECNPKSLQTMVQKIKLEGLLKAITLMLSKVNQ